MLFRIGRRLSSAKQRVRTAELAARADLLLAGVSDPVELETAIAEDERVTDAQLLVSAREQQKEDWLALGIFFLFLGGADAFVSAHLKDFPVQPEINANDTGVVEVGFKVPLGNW